MSNDYETKHGIKLEDSLIHDQQMGSDHCPVELQLTLTDTGKKSAGKKGKSAKKSTASENVEESKDDVPIEDPTPEKEQTPASIFADHLKSEDKLEAKAEKKKRSKSQTTKKEVKV